MAQQNKKTLSQLLYPYMFMLREGPEFKNDFLDYSLLILQTKSEVIPSPPGLVLPKPPETIEFPF